MPASRPRRRGAEARLLVPSNSKGRVEDPPFLLSSSRWTILLCLLMTVALVRLWVAPMWSSFWVDEMGTAFVVHHGGDHPSFAVAPQVPQSIYYLLPRAAERVFGFSEFSYRLPSLLALGCALLLIARIAARTIHPQAGWFAACACLTLRGFDYQAADARPYALGTLVACASVWFLMRWLDTDRWAYALGLLAAAALVWRVQLIFWPFYVVLGIYAVTRLIRGETDVTWLRLIAVTALLGVCLMPVLLQALVLFRQAGSHVVVAEPTLRDLLYSLKVGLVAGGAACGILLYWVSRKLVVPAPVPTYSSRVLMLVWWFAEPLCLFAFSWLSGNSVFLSRYLWLSLPGTVLAATLAASIYLPARFWQPAAVVLLLWALAANGQWRERHPLHHNSDWRGAAHKVAELVSDETPVICPSPFVEARPPAWGPTYRLPGFLYAHLDVYPVRGQLRLFPFAGSEEADADATQFLRRTLVGAGRFALYSGQGQVDYWTKWFARQPELSGWAVDRYRDFADVEVVVFRAPGHPIAQ